MEAIRKFLRIAPQEDESGAFTPSPFARKIAVENKTDYDPNTSYANKYEGSVKKKILVVCTEERYMTMQNGRKFSSGNHPVETFVPILHLEQAGFEIELCTPTGASVKIEDWAIPSQDEAVMGILKKYESKLEKPLSLAGLVPKLDSSYVAVFIPGGHGAMLGLPDNKDLGQLIEWADKNDKYMLSICHGPAALLAAASEEKEFVYKDYEIACFPDKMDKITPAIGYMPGQMPWYFGAKLTEQGVKIINSSANGTVHKDRKLVTGDSPKAANAFGKLAAESLLADLAKE